MNNIVKLVLILTLISAICTAILAVVNGFTKEPIAQSQERRVLESARKVLPAGSTPEAREFVAAGKTNKYFVATDANGKVSAVAIQGLAPKGYGGSVNIMFGITAAGQLINYEVTQHTETPGLGAKIVDDPFRSNVLKDRDGQPRHVATTNWKVTKDGGAIDAVTAATISSRATLDALRDALAIYDALKPTF